MVPEEAKKRIAENKRTRDKSLDLGNLGLTRVPAAVGELVWLEELSLARNEIMSHLAPLSGLSALRALDVSNTLISNLAPLSGLPDLHTLDASSTQVRDLAPLSGLSALQILNVSQTQIRDLAPLARLSTLQSFDIRGTKVADLAPLTGLSALQSLDIARTEVSDLAPLTGLSALQTLRALNTQVTDLAPLAGLSALQLLNVAATQVIDLAPLASLSALRALSVGDTKVIDLAPLARLSALQVLDVSGTQVTDLPPLVGLIRRGCPVKWSSTSWEGDGIYVGKSPFTNPPPEIAKQGNKAVLNYFAERERGGVDHLYEAKMLILGEGRAGKTSLLTRLYRPGQPLPAESDTTRGINISRQEFKLKNGHTFRPNIWDFGGQQIYHATHQFFLTHRSLYVLVDDTAKDNKSVSDVGFKDWLELIEVFGGHSPTLIFQNEKDGRSKAIEIGGIRQRYDNVKEVYAGDLARADAADKMREGIEFYAANLSHIGEELPARWLQVRADIEQLAAKEPYVPVEKYFDIYRKHIEFDETKALLLSRYLHDLGVFLHFQDDLLLKDTVILQNQWATEAAFRVLDDETIKKNLGRFNRGDCARL